MKRMLTAALIPAIAAAPALAHEGAHMHPHGVDAWTVALVLLGITCAAIVIWKARK